LFDAYIENLEISLKNERNEYYKQKGRMETLAELSQKSYEKLDSLHKENDKLQKVKLLLQNASQFAREQSKTQMEYLVTQCLQYIFDPSMEFRIQLIEKANRIEGDFFVVSKINNSEIVTRPQDSRGGGVVDVISLALRVAMMEIHDPKIDGPIILDEPAKHVSEDFIGNVAEFLKQISTLFNRQIIMVTHNHHLLESADVCYNVKLNDGVSIVESVNLT
jgi:DNA repair exonuclease SbcCD ATPase subunit